MSRYIDADALNIPSEEMIAKMIINSAPSIDIVRCKECKSYYTKAYQDGYGYCESHHTVLEDNNFCSYGERMEVMYYPQVDGITPSVISTERKESE